MNLTYEQIMYEPAGKRMDAWVAEYVMGWKHHDGEQPYWIEDTEDGDFIATQDINWEPSTKLNDAFEVVKKFEFGRAKDGRPASCMDLMMFDTFRPDNWSCFFYSPLFKQTASSIADTPTLAICRAALMAIKAGY